MKKVPALVMLLFLTFSSNGWTRHHHFDTSPSEGFTLERDTYTQGSYYYPTFTQMIGEEWSLGITGQNLSTWDTQDSAYGMIGWNPEVTDDLSFSFGAVIGSTFTQPSIDAFYYVLGNYDLCDNFTLSVGPYDENGTFGYMVNGLITMGDWQLAPYYMPGTPNFAGSGVNLNYQLSPSIQPYVGYGYAGGESYLAIGVNISN